MFTVMQILYEIKEKPTTCNGVFKVGIIKMGGLISLSAVLYFYTKYSLFFYGKCALNVIQPYILLGEMQI